MKRNVSGQYEKIEGEKILLKDIESEGIIIYMEHEGRNLRIRSMLEHDAEKAAKMMKSSNSGKRALSRQLEKPKSEFENLVIEELFQEDQNGDKIQIAVIVDTDKGLITFINKKQYRNVKDEIILGRIDTALNQLMKDFSKVQKKDPKKFSKTA